jgi:hypothetical protein
VKVRIGDLVLGGQIRGRAVVTQAKTGRPVQFELMSDARASLRAWLDRRGNQQPYFEYVAHPRPEGGLPPAPINPDERPTGKTRIKAAVQSRRIA